MMLDGKRGKADTILSDEAIDWLVKLYSGQATDADRAAFAQWRSQSHEHALAADEAEAIWSGIGIAGDQVRRTERKAARAKLTRRAVLGGVALTAVGLAAGQAGLIGPHLLADHVTGVGEQRTVHLEDGSTVFMNAGTSLSVDIGMAERRLHLFGGEAIFTVAHDPMRPFIVHAGNGYTRALGTVFDVDVRSREVVVTVLEGVVEVAANLGSVTAHVDQRTRYAADGRPAAVEKIDADLETAWRRGKLIFNRRPLGDVVAEIERYRGGQIIIASAALRRLEVTGVFDLAEPEAILRTIEETLPVRVTRLPYVTVIR